MRPAAQWLWKRRLETPVTASTESRVAQASSPASLIAVRAIASELCCAEFNRWFLETEIGKPVGLPHINLLSPSPSRERGSGGEDLPHNFKVALADSYAAISYGFSTIDDSSSNDESFQDGPSYSDRIAEALGRSRQVKRHLKNTF